jgi:TatA/E family protein of Tat protein translocase
MLIAELASLDVILIVVVVIALIFGSTKIPKIARGLGSAKTEFEKGLKEGDKSTAAQTDEQRQPDKPTA